jgi:hypothetical protein
MSPLKRFDVALFRTLLDQGGPDRYAGSVASGFSCRTGGTTSTAPNRPHTAGNLAQRDHCDGGWRSFDGPVLESWAKYAIPKGLPLEEGARRMAIENEPIASTTSTAALKAAAIYALF